VTVIFYDCTGTEIGRKQYELGELLYIPMGVMKIQVLIQIEPATPTLYQQL
jgi:hypothetical protein